MHIVFDHIKKFINYLVLIFFLAVYLIKSTYLPYILEQEGFPMPICSLTAICELHCAFPFKKSFNWNWNAETFVGDTDIDILIVEG